MVQRRALVTPRATWGESSETIDGAVGLLMILPRVLYNGDVTGAAQRVHDVFDLG